MFFRGRRGGSWLLHVIVIHGIDRWTIYVQRSRRWRWRRWNLLLLILVAIFFCQKRYQCCVVIIWLGGLSRSRQKKTKTRQVKAVLACGCVPCSGLGSFEVQRSYTAAADQAIDTVVLASLILSRLSLPFCITRPRSQQTGLLCNCSAILLYAVTTNCGPASGINPTSVVFRRSYASCWVFRYFLEGIWPHVVGIASQRGKRICHK